jgi:hypothetical protein
LVRRTNTPQEPVGEPVVHIDRGQPGLQLLLGDVAEDADVAPAVETVGLPIEELELLPAPCLPGDSREDVAVPAHHLEGAAELLLHHKEALRVLRKEARIFDPDSLDQSLTTGQATDL